MAEDAKSAQTTATRASLKTKPPESAPVKKEEEETFGQFIWNSQTKEFLGRTGKSWCLITIFYIIFFTALAAFFWFSWLVSLIFVNLDRPLKSGEGSLLFDSGPGLAFRPRSGDSILIEFKPGDPKKWSGQLESWFKKIPTTHVKECNDSVKADEKKACLVPKDVYGPCSPTSDSSFGYSKSEPCILLKLNRIFYWKPEPFSKKEWEGFLDPKEKKIKIEGASESIPISDGLAAMIKTQMEGGSGGERNQEVVSIDDLAKQAPSTTESASATTEGETSSTVTTTFDLKTNIPIWCEQDKKDKKKLEAIEYYPGPFIPAYYFPFQGQKNYQSPFVMIQLKGVPNDKKEISIVCQAFAKNIKLDKETGVGYARFQVKIK